MIELLLSKINNTQLLVYETRTMTATCAASDLRSISYAEPDKEKRIHFN